MTVTNRGWVKNAAIIFLSVLLVLTFFSNTIMNYSLPEVAGAYARYGSISTSVRGQGTVAANMSYSVQIGETRQIKSVLVKSGERVEAGQLLFELEPTESDELQVEIKKLDALNLALKKKLLQIKPADYGTEERAIALLQEEIAELESKRGRAGEHELALEVAKQLVKDASAVVELLTEEQTAIEEKITAMASSDEYDYEKLLTDGIIALREKLEAATAAQKAAQKALESAEAALADGGGSGGSVSGIQSAITAKANQITTLKTQREGMRFSILLLIESTYGDGTGMGTPVPVAPQAYIDYLIIKADPASTSADIEAAANALFSPSLHGEQSILDALTAMHNLDVDIQNAETDLHNLENDYYQTQSSNNVNAQLKNNVNIAKSKLETAKETTESAQKEYDRALKDLTNVFKTELSEKKAEVKTAQSALDAAKAAQTEIEQETVQKPEEIDAAVKAKEREIENKLFTLSQQKIDDGIAKAISDLDLQTDRKEIEEQEAVIEKLRSKSQSAEITSRYGGIITAVNVIPGDKAESGKELASMDLDGKGFTTSFSVTAQQAQRLQIGATQVISSYYSEDLMVTLIAIRPDPQSQGRLRILEFSVDGPVSVGQILNISIGERDQSYEYVLPNSAIREDADGTFVLVTETKSTPLGSRYTAKRIDVTVLAKDDVNTAISSSGYNYEFVITTATKPVEPGTLVRLSNK